MDKKNCLSLGGTFELPAKQSKIQDLEQKIQDPKLWKDNKALKAISKEKTELQKLISEWQTLNQSVKDSQVLLEVLQESPDEKAFLDLKKDYTFLQKDLNALTLKSLLNKPQDKNNCYVALHAGAGGKEAGDWAEILQRMYFKWAEQKGFAIDILSLSAGEGVGIRSSQFLVKGLFAYGYLRSEIGVHRLVRISPFDSNARRHTSFASVFVWPEADDSIVIDIKDGDLRTDTYRASGAGGQHINKTDSAIRITHTPTGLVVQCQSQRSQHANRQQAMKMLRSALYDREEKKKQQEKEKLESSKKANEWGSQIRSYILHPYQMVKDHRSQWSASDPSAVLSGKLDDFIFAYLKSS